MSSGDWFPPARPNSDVDILRTHPKPSLDNHISVAEPNADLVAESTVASDAHDNKGEDDSRFPDYEAGNDLKDNSTDNAHPPAEVAQHDETDDTPHDEIPHIANDIPQHTSRMSFARTAHEVNLDNDEDEDEPNPTGTDHSTPRADLFAFMPPNDRTNSFPPVPPREKEEHTQSEGLLPTDHIEEGVHQSDPVRDHTIEETSDSSQGPIADQSSETRDNEYTTTSYPLMGGESTNDVEGGSTEFTPLFPSGHDGVAEENPSQDETDMLGIGEAADGDDFFSQIQEDGNQQPVAEDVSFAHVQETQSEQVAEEDDFFTQVQVHGDGSENLVKEESKEVDDFFTQVQGMESEQPAEDDDFFTKVQDEQDHTADLFEQGLATEETVGRDEGYTAEEANQAAIGDIQEAPEAGPEVTSESAPKTAEAPAVEDEGDFWGEIAEEDEFLPDENTEVPGESIEADPIDATAFLPSDDEGFLPSDDEGFLDDSEDQQQDAEESAAPVTPTAPAAPSARYLPASQPPNSSSQQAHSYFPTGAIGGQAPATGNIYAPAAAIPAIPTPAPFGVPPAAQPAPAAYGYGAPLPPAKPTTKTQSFADKSKGGYTSPYDLPMEVVKPKKRASMANLHKATPGPNALAPGVPPPRSASYNAAPPPPPATYAKVPPQGAFQQPPPPVSKTGSTESKYQEKFFEDLPITTKPRPTSRQSNKSLPSPQTGSYPVPPQAGPPFTQQTSAPHVPQIPHAPSQPVADVPGLVAPPRVNPYASLPSNAPTLGPAAPAGTATRYSPAPPSGLQPNGSNPPPIQSRYSPAPPATRQASAGHAPPAVASAPPILPHQPRTSSPLAHFEISHDKARAGAANHSDGNLADRRVSSSMYDPRLQRVPSLPPTREVEEEETQELPQTAAQYAPPPQQTSPPTSRHGQVQVPYRPRQTTPPSSHLGPSPLSPPTRATSGYVPAATTHDFAPPPRSQTQSPGALYGNRNGKAIEAVPRPSSVHDPAPPRSALYSASGPPAVSNSASTSPVLSRSRAFSQNLNLVAPTDGRENDTLQRWRGAPLISWGVGGTIVTMFPKNIPRYGMHQTVPMVVRSPGEVKLKSAKDIQPLEERLAKFPGPLKGKSKKKETIAWLNTGIESLEATLPTALYAQQHASHEDKRATERVLLWKILRLFVEHDGTLEGNPTIEKAVRDILLPDAEKPASSPIYLTAGSVTGPNELPATAMRSDAVDASAVEQIQLHLQNGDAEKAVWTAVDKRLWGHALILANALAPTLYKQVAQEFVKKEINLPGQKHESLAALYTVLSGNHEDSVDELVPLIARSGRQLVAKNTAPGSSKDALDGLDKWRETLGLILSNRSTDDARAINALGNLLSDYGRAEAAHICFLFARSQTVFGGLDDPKSNFVLVGSDHKRQSEQFAKEIEPLLLSEVYEYGQSLAGAATVPVSNPHLAAYKLQHALALAEFGYRDKALQYCEAIFAAITAQTKRSPYHHAILEAAVQDLMIRLRQAPKEESSSWIPKPSMNKVSDTMWNRFNKFVAGDENDASGQGSPNEESGPFARIAGGTPTISRSPSANNLETFGATIPSYGMPPNIPANGPVAPPLSSSAPSTKAASRYAPGAGNPYDSSSAYAPRSSMERSSGEYQRSSLDLPRQSSEFQPGYAGSYSPNKPSPPNYTPNHSHNIGLSREPSYGAMSPPQTSAPSFGYEPLGHPSTSVNGAALGPTPSLGAPAQTSSAGGYQPSYGYEPPSQTSYEPLPQSSQPSFEPPAADNNTSSQVNSFEPPSYQPYGYEPPMYEPDSQPANDDESDEESKPKPKKKGIMYDDEDDFGAKKPATDRSKEDKDRENAEMFRKAAEEDAKRAAEAKQGGKKGWGFTGWFGGGAKKESQETVAAPNKPVRAKLGEANSFYYDPDQKRWVNKNAGPEETTAKKAAPPPPRSAPPMPRSASSSPAPPTSTPMSIPGADAGRASAPPPGGPPRPPMGMTPPMSSTPESGSLAPGPPVMMRSVSNTSSAAGGPPSRPTTSLSNSSSIDDLLAAAGPRKAGAKKARKSARYVDVMTK